MDSKPTEWQSELNELSAELNEYAERVTDKECTAFCETWAEIQMV